MVARLEGVQHRGKLAITAVRRPSHMPALTYAVIVGGRINSRVFSRASLFERPRDAGHGRDVPSAASPCGIKSRGNFCESPDAIYANMTISVALLRRTSGTILSYVSRLVCMVVLLEFQSSAPVPLLGALAHTNERRAC